MRRVRISSHQRQVLDTLNKYRPLADGVHEWKTARLFDPRTVRSLIARKLVQSSTGIEWMLKYNLDDIAIRITPEGVAALKTAEHPATSTDGEG